jgi:hypothetical protein
MKPHTANHPIFKAARGRLCTLRTPVCNNDRETTVFAHVYVGPKAMGGKGLPIHGIFCCSACHDAVDRRVVCHAWEPMRYYETLRALIETQTVLYDIGELLTKRELKADVPQRLSKIIPHPGHL